MTVNDVANGFALQEFNPAPAQIDYRVIDITANAGHHVHWDLAVGGRTRFAIDGAEVLDTATRRLLGE